MTFSTPENSFPFVLTLQTSRRLLVLLLSGCITDLQTTQKIVTANGDTAVIGEIREGSATPRRDPPSPSYSSL